jgi:hypothetical protein
VHIYDNNAESVFELPDEEFTDEMLSNSLLKRIPNYLFKDKLSNPIIVSQIAMGLLNILKDLPKPLNCGLVEQLLPKSDKELYI